VNIQTLRYYERVGRHWTAAWEFASRYGAAVSMYSWMSRRLGPLGTLARLGVGSWMAGSVLIGHLRGPFTLLPWVLGLIVLPIVATVWHRWYVGRGERRLNATGPIGHLSHVLLFCGMLIAPDYVPALWFAPDTAFLFYGSAMLIAAVRGQSDCEVLALSNWLLRRDDRIGCIVFAPVDHIDRGIRRLTS
jgi:hypothetical protein